MSAAIKLKKSSVTGKSPLVGDLAYGELAINYADGRLFYVNSSNEVKNFIDSDLINSYVSATVADYLPLTGGTMQGNIDMNDAYKLVNVSAPIADNDVATKIYVDTVVATGLSSTDFPFGDYGSVDSESPIDPFGIAIGTTYDMLTDPQSAYAYVDLGIDETDSSI